MDEELYLEIERYLANEMSVEERASFEDRMKHNSVLAEKFDVYRSASGLLSTKLKGEDKEKAFKKTLSEMEVNVAAQGKSRAIQFYTWAAAASVALLCVALFYTSSSKPHYDEYAHYEPLTLVERGDQDVIKLHAQEDFNAKEYEKAIANLDELLKQDQANAELQLYKGIALLELNQVKEANKLFNSVRNSGTIFKDKGTWMLALSALKQNDYEKCKALLKEIPKNSPGYQDAQRLLDDL